MTTLSLSQELWKLGLRINTEKRWIEYKTQQFSLYDRNTSPARWSGQEYPAYSTDDLLEILPNYIDPNLWLTIRKLYRTWEVGYMFSESWLNQIENVSLPEALAKMTIWLLENGYEFKDGRIEKR